MLPAPEKIMLAVLHPAAPARGYLLRAQLHLAPRLCQKYRDAHEGILQTGKDKLHIPHHARSPACPIFFPLPSSPHSDRNDERYINCEAFRAIVNNRLAL
ncbi:MAG: hypothetical protein J0H18_03450 [Rhizobiales bacterium]|nr:hypothetical protein [Hyphomicrobiales bacterium]